MNWIAKRTLHVEKRTETGAIIRPSWLYQRYHEEWQLQREIALFNLSFFGCSCIY